MTRWTSWSGMGLGLFAAVALLAAGCDDAAKSGKKEDGKAVAKKEDGKAVAKKEESKLETKTAHSGWWCDEHGVQEAECSMCSAAASKACKAKGDWCDKHDRAKSQCFICDPTLKDKFAAQYKAKYGKEPPEPDGQKEEKKEETKEKK